MISEDKTLSEINELIIKFRDERNWEQFHTLKDLLIGLTAEVGELNELFLWKNVSDISELPRTPIEEEIADIYIFLAYIAKHLNIDIGTAILHKLHKISTKYPIEKSYGNKKNILNFSLFAALKNIFNLTSKKQMDHLHLLQNTE